MSWVPRFPEIKANLDLSNGEFGTYLSLGSVGAVIAMLSSGHFVHKLGAKKVLIIAALSMCLSIAVIAHLQSAPIFIIVNMINGGSVAAFNIALNRMASFFSLATNSCIKQWITSAPIEAASVGSA